MNFDRTDLPPDHLQGTAVAAFFYEDQRPLEGAAGLLDWRLNGQLTDLILRGRITGRAGEQVVLQGNHKLHAQWVLLVGGGKWEGLCKDTYEKLILYLFRVARDAGFNDLALSLSPHAEITASELETAVMAAGEQLGLKDFNCRLSCVGSADEFVKNSELPM